MREVMTRSELIESILGDCAAFLAMISYNIRDDRECRIWDCLESIRGEANKISGYLVGMEVKAEGGGNKRVMDHICGDCCWWNRGSIREGECRWHAPIANVNPEIGSVYTMTSSAYTTIALFPRTDEDDWCGKWGPR